jgi:hypothetical protein
MLARCTALRCGWCVKRVLEEQKKLVLTCAAAADRQAGSQNTLMVWFQEAQQQAQAAKVGAHLFGERRDTHRERARGRERDR